MKIRIGTRGSKLALIQAEIVKKELLLYGPSIEIQIVPIKTTGDNNKSADLTKLGGKALFLKEIEEELLAKNIDIAVHSMKDVPAMIPKGLKIAAVLERVDSRDVFVSNNGKSFLDLEEGAIIGTSSPRRAVQILTLRPDFHIVPFRGNVDSRLKKVQDNEVDATMLALAGLERLGLYEQSYQILDRETMIPAVGQGVICIECREEDQDMLKLLAAINHSPTEILMKAERAFLETIEGNCKTPMGACAEFIDSANIQLTAFLAREDNSKIVIKTEKGLAVNAYKIGEAMANSILKEIVKL